jgi:CDP-4-dehydro-6-deoxyglucose reductase
MIASAAIQNIERRALSLGPPVQILTLELAGAFAFDAGQYLTVLHPDGTAIPLSIASPPELLPKLNLHYRSTPGLAEALQMDELLKGDRLQLEGGAGDVRLSRDDDRPLLLVAGGTGVSQALCLALAQTSRHPNTSVQMLACADAEADLYFTDLLPTSPGFSAELIADSNRDDSNRGLSWLAENAAATASDTRVVLSGSPAFVYAATDTLITAGLNSVQLESDVYAWAPR